MNTYQRRAHCPRCGEVLVLAPAGDERTDLRNADDLTPHRLTCSAPDRDPRRQTRSLQLHDDVCPACGTIGDCQEVSDRFGAVHTCLACRTRRYTPLVHTRQGAKQGRFS